MHKAQGTCACKKKNKKKKKKKKTPMYSISNGNR
jgi:hypothetical protein